MWDTNAVFLAAQNNLFGSVKEYVGAKISLSPSDVVGFVRALDQGIASGHHAHLKYPPQLLILALVYRMQGASVDESVAAVLSGNFLQKVDVSDVAKMAADFQANLTQMPALCATVVEGLEKANVLGYKMILITEGRLERQRRIIDHHRINKYFEAELELTKTPDQYRRLAMRFGGNDVYMIGDQLDRDIFPAESAGLKAIYVAGGFVPEWNQGAQPSPNCRQADSFVGAINLIAAGAC